MVVEFPIDKFLKHKIDLMIKRVMDNDENDNCLIIEGDTGVGKTNVSVGIAYLVSQATGRTFDNSRIFFDTAKAVAFAKDTREQIIIFDEPAFGGLKAEWRKKTQIDLIKLLYTARIKRHFIIFNLVKFSKFNDDIIEKAIAMIRVYRKNESTKARRFLYIPKKRIPSLLEFWHRKHFRNYNKFAIAHGSIFRYVLPEIINKEEYNKLKEESISMIGNEEKVNKKTERRILALQQKISQGHKRIKALGFNINLKDYAAALQISDGSPSRWNEQAISEGFSLENDASEPTSKALIIDKGQ